MASKPHILILSSWYPNKQNPQLGNFVQRHAGLLAKEYNVTVLNTVADSNCKSYIFNDGTSSEFNEVIVVHPKSNSLFKRKKEERVALRKGLNMIKNVDLVVGHIALSKGRQFTRAKKHFNCPLIYIEHGSYFRKEKKNNWRIYDRFIFNSLVKNSDSIIAVSEILKNDMKSVCSAKIEVIGNHVNEKTFSLKEKKRNELTQFLHVSTLDPDTKNPQGIIDACHLLQKSGLKFKLTIICDGNFTPWQSQVAAKGLDNVIQFIGPVEWETTVSYYQSADAFILNSDYETFSIVLIESLMTGTPLITKRVGVAAELSKTHGIIIQNNGELITAMQQFIESGFTYSPKKLRDFGLQYSEEKILSKWRSLIASHVG